MNYEMQYENSHNGGDMYRKIDNCWSVYNPNKNTNRII